MPPHHVRRIAIGLLALLGGALLSVRAHAADPPVVGVTPDSLAAELFTGQRSSQALHLSNTGASDLNYRIDVRWPAPVTLAAAAGAASTGGLRILVINVDGDVTQIRGLLAAMPDVAVVDVFSAKSAAPTLALLQQYDAVVVSVTTPADQSAAIGNALADYADGGGGVVMMLVSYIGNPYAITGRLLSGGYLPFNLSIPGDPAGTSTLGMFDATHPIMQDVHGLSADYIRQLTLAPGAQLVASFARGYPLVATQGRHVVGINVYVGWTGFWTGDVPRLLHNAIAWASRPSWLTVTPDHGTLAPGASVDAAVDFDGIGAAGGDHDGLLRVSSNDPIRPQADVWTRMHVTAAPDLRLSADALHFGTRFTGTTRTDSLVVSNIGSAPLEVTGASADAPDFTAEPTEFTLAPDASRVLHVTFAPTLAGLRTANLTITSNDPDRGVATVALDGTALDPPAAAIQPDSLAADLLTGQQSWAQLHLSNTGATDLTYRIDVRWPPPVTLALPSGAPAEATSGLRVLIVNVDGDVSQIRGLLAAMPDVALVDVFSAKSAAPTLAQLQQYDAAVVSVTTPSNQSAAIGNVLADYVDGGGGVVMMLVSYMGLGYNIGGRLLSGGYFPFQLAGQPAGSSTLGTFQAMHPIMRNVGSLSADYIRQLTLAPGAQLVASFANGFPLVATQGRHVVGVNVYVGWTGFWTGDVPTLLHNAIAWSSRPTWLSVNPDHGTLAPGASTDIAVGFDAFGLIGGDYPARLTLTSNDPVRPTIDVPSRLHVTGVPDIAAAPDSLHFGTCFTGTVHTDSVLVRNVGTDVLNVTAASSDAALFAVEPPAFSLAPGAGRSVRVAFTPSTPGPRTGTVTLSSNDPDEAAVAVTLDGSVVDPPSAGFAPDSVAAELLTGQRAIRTVHVANTGASDLVYDVVGTRRPVAPAPQPGSLRILLVNSAGDDSQIRGLLAAMPDVAVVDEFAAGNAAPSLSLLRQYDAAIVTVSDPSSQPAAIGDALADYVDAGGGVVMMLLSYIGSGYSVTGRLLGGGYVPFVAASGQATTSTLGTFLPSHPIMQNVHALSAGVIRPLTLTPGAKLVASFANGYPLVATQGRHVVGVNAYVGAPGFWTGDLPALLHDAVVWASGPSWLTALPEHGTVAPGSTADLTLTLDAARLYGGDYPALLDLATNDPVHPGHTIAARLQVTAAPDLALSSDSLEFGTLFVGATRTDTLVVRNAGTLALDVTAITPDLPEFTAEPANFSLAPGASRIVTVTYTPTSPGTHPGALAITSNDPDDGHLAVALRGVALAPPVLGVTPDSLAADLLRGQQAVRTLRLANTGLADLAFGISIESETTPVAAARDSVRATVAPGLRILVVNSGGNDSQIRALLAAMPGVGAVDEFAAGTAPPGLSLLMQYDAAIVTVSTASSQAAAIGDALADYADLGGGVVLALYSHVSGTLGISGRLRSGGYFPFQPGGGALGTLALGTFDPAHPIMQGVTTLISNITRQTTLAAGAQLVASYADGTPLVATQGHRVVGVNFYVGSSATWSGDAPRLLLNAVSWSRRPAWLSADPDHGTVAPGATRDVTVTLDAAGRYGGDYTAVLAVTSNDPAHPRVALPAHLHVTGIPDIALVSDSIRFASQFVGLTRVDSVLVRNVGTDALDISGTVSGTADFTVSPGSMQIAPGTERAVRVTFAPISGGPHAGTLTLTSNDPDEATLTVALAGSGIDPPRAAVNPESLVVTLPYDERAKPVLHLANVGTGDLTWSVSAQLPPGTVPTSKLRIMIVNSGGDVSQIRTLLLGMSDVATVDVLDALTSAPTAFNLQSYDVALVSVTSPSGRAADIGNILADYADAGGGVVLMLASYVGNGYNISGRLLTGGYFPFLLAGEPAATSALGSYDADHPIMQNIHALTADATRPVELAPGAELVASLANGFPLVATQGRHVVAVNASIGASNTWTGDLPALVRNAAAWTRPQAWLRLGPASGTLSTGAGVDLPVLFDAAWLPVGDYRATLHVTSSDPIRPQVDVPAHLTVVGVPHLALSAGAIDFGRVFRGSTAARPLVLRNPGTATLHVTGLAPDPAAFTADASSLNLAPGASDTVSITFAPSLPGSYTGALTITSDDPDAPTTTVALAGHFDDPPVVAVSPDSFDVSLPSGQVATRVLHAANSGASPLAYQVMVLGAGPGPGAAVAPAPPVAGTVLAPSADGSAGVASAVGAAASATASSVSGAKVLIVEDQLPWGRDANETLLTSFGATYDVINSQQFAGTSLAPYRLVVLPSVQPTSAYQRIAADSAKLESFVRLGGVLEFHAAGLTSGSDSWRVPVPGGLHVAPHLALFNHVLHPEHAIASGVPADFSASYASHASLLSIPAFADSIVRDDTGQPDLVVYPYGAGKVVCGTQPFEYAWANHLAFGPLLPNMLAYSLRLADAAWLSADPLSAVVPPGGGADVTLRFDAAGLGAGDYLAEVRVLDDDPVRPVVRVPVRLHVTGTPDIDLSRVALDFGTVVVGGAIAETLVVRNTGTGPLAVTGLVAAPGAFAAPAAGFSLAPAATHPVVVSFSPAAAGTFTGTLTVTSDDPDEGTVVVPLTGTATPAPAVTVDTTPISVTLVPGGKTSQPLHVQSTGLADLAYRLRIRSGSPAPAAAARAVAGRGARSAAGAGIALPGTGLVPASAATAAKVLIVQDVAPWGLASNQQVLTANGIAYDVITSAQLAATDLAPYRVLLVPSRQPTAAYSTLASRAAQLAAFVNAGGVLEFHAAGEDPSSSSSLVTLPGNVHISAQYLAVANYAQAPGHELLAGLASDPLTGQFVSTAHLNNPLPAGTPKLLIDDSGRATLAEWRFGAGRVIAAGLTLESAWANGWDSGALLANLLPYALRVAETPWLAADPASAQLGPGEGVDVTLAFDAAYLSLGGYDATVVLQSNDPLHSPIAVPVHLDVTGPVATDVTLVSAAYDAPVVRISWQGGRAGASATVYRSAPGDGWSPAATIAADGAGGFAYADAGVLAGARYGYRLGLAEAGSERLVGEAWVDVPVAVRLSLEGPDRNPAVGAMVVSFALPDGRPATLELIDVTGRRVDGTEVGSLGPGPHRVALGAGAPPGLYLVRLRHPERTLVRRAAVIR